MYYSKDLDVLIKTLAILMIVGLIFLIGLLIGIPVFDCQPSYIAPTLEFSERDNRPTVAIGYRTSSLDMQYGRIVYAPRYENNYSWQVLDVPPTSRMGNCEAKYWLALEDAENILNGKDTGDRVPFSVEVSDYLVGIHKMQESE